MAVRIIDEDSDFLDRLQSKVTEDHLIGTAADVIFECARCGRCCRGGGYAIVCDQDINQIANAIGSSPKEVREAFTDPDPENRPGIRMLRNIGPGNLCIFYDANNKSCKIYDFRPAVCRTHPMMNILPGHGLMLHPNCPGTANLVNTLRMKKDDTFVKRYVERLRRKKKLLLKLKIKLFIYALQRQGLEEKAQEKARLYGIKLPLDENDFRKACLAYLFLNIDIRGLNEYEYKDDGGG